MVWLQMLQVPDLSVLDQYHGAYCIQVYDAKDQFVSSVALGQKSIAVPSSEIPKHVHFAVPAAEDYRF